MSEETDSISDGYHTFGELYEHRHILYCALINSHQDISWKSRLHNDGTMFDGWFIAGMDLNGEQITYHMPMDMYDMFRCKVLKKSPEWDGHTSNDVIKRLENYCVMSK